ncbi:phosphoribosylamine--glycine ligase [Brackiella oedipodis]|uniref:phosphoribosylamine--glycine ligase n=1 Tax=Brackiella oedipodis TaxID=124225 RepID=UPI00048A6208|nr:phosphoribosylamine--glycine ligase [Brackiella oedipodis]
MKILVVGAGGREHALAWKIAQSPQATEVFVAPGNGGTALAPNLHNINAKSAQQCLEFALQEGIDFTVVGPEAPLAAGIVDLFRANGLAIFGPKQAAAQLESSKTFAKEFMQRHHIPTAAYAVFNDAQQAHDYVRQQGVPIVIKADGLAAGKGVIVAETLEQADQAIDDMLGGFFGQAGAKVVIEEFLTGEEASFIVMADGKHVLPLASSQDHKRQLDHDQGPNTGGMGAYSPAPIVSEVLHRRIMQEVIEPTMQGMLKDGIEYTGFLYAGLMIGEGNDQERPIKVLEFNARMGDPETQPIMMRLQSDFVALLQAAQEQRLDQIQAQWDPRPAIGVVMAAYNYPVEPRTGDSITGLPEDQADCVVFHAGTALANKAANSQLLTSGGRVLCVTALGQDLEAARDRAYATVQAIHFEGAQYRSDIAWRALKQA